jgi:hypothetical protein
LVRFAFFFVVIIDLRVKAAQLPAGSPCGHQRAIFVELMPAPLSGG